MFDAVSSSAAGSRHAVAFCCDQNYLPYAALTAHEIIARCDGDFDIVLCSTTPLELPATAQHPRIRTVTVEVGDTFAKLYRDARRTDLTYLRMLLPDVFAEDYSRILYLDSDLSVRKGDIAGLLAVDLSGRSVGAVRDTRQWRTPSREMSDVVMLGQSMSRYFNAGVMLIDTRGFRENGHMRRLLEFGAKHGAKLQYADQTLLNCVLKDDWVELSPVWNWQFSWSARMFEPMVGANIIHFIGPKKPWNDTAGTVPPGIVAEYARFIARHFPDRSVNRQIAPPMTDLIYFRKMAIRSFLSAHRMRRYISRFPDELTVQR